MSTEWSARRNKAHSLLKERRSRRKHQEGALADSTQIQDSPFVTPLKLEFGSESLSEVQEQISSQQIQSPLRMEITQNESTSLTATADSPQSLSQESAQELKFSSQNLSTEPRQDLFLPRSPHRIRHSAITAYLDASDGNIRAAQSLSRHANLNTLNRYDDNRHKYQAIATNTLADLV